MSMSISELVGAGVYNVVPAGAFAMQFVQSSRHGFKHKYQWFEGSD